MEKTNYGTNSAYRRLVVVRSVEKRGDVVLELCLTVIVVVVVKGLKFLDSSLKVFYVKTIASSMKTVA